MLRSTLVAFTVALGLAACTPDAPNTVIVHQPSPQRMLATLPGGLVGYWPGDGTATDVEGGNNGTLMNGATYACGRTGQAFSFDGVDDQVLIHAAPVLDVGQGNGFTFAAWIFPMGLNASQVGTGPIIEYSSPGIPGSPGTHFWVYAQTDTTTAIHSLYVNYITSPFTGQFTALNTITQFAWNHVAATYSYPDGIVTLYVNGVNVGSQPFGQGHGPTSSDLNLGYRDLVSGGVNSFRGLLEDVQIYNRSLDASEVQGLGTAPATSSCPTYTFSGFLPPVDNLPNVNDAKAGQAIPVNFSLAGAQGLDVFAAGYPASQNQACDSSTPVQPLDIQPVNIDEGLSAHNDRYAFKWKTNESWGGTCRQLELRFKDGSSHVAAFRFK